MAPNIPPMIGPVLGLAGWTFVMESWMYAYRLPDLQKYKVKVNPSMSKADMNSQIPRHRQFPADNYDHLHEQPTVFYAVALSLAFMEADDRVTVGLAWGYVAMRVVHSLLQATTNVIPRRFVAFATSSLILLGLTGRAAQRCFF
ncbi:MAPEG family [Lecanosticta acicola]|uniref:MAPEG family n=1 Tax=Lecanosticta acicola TaxID=111012 RepID=A0AAI8YRW3_9PEZI|nr:MAPEG family [Lecanosticta acicola]